MQLAGISDEPTKYMIFKVKAGILLLDIFRNTKSDENAPDVVSNPFSNAMYRLKTYFGSGSDIMLQRRKLALMFQKQGESDSAYITRVGATARLCEYGTERESETIMGTVANHARCKEVRTAALKMLHRKGSFTELIDKVREIECIRLSEQFFKERHEPIEPANVAPVSADFPLMSQRYRRQNFNNQVFSRRNVRGHPPRSYVRPGTQRFFGHGRFQQTSAISQNSPQRYRCWRCTSMYHDPSDCHAIDKICRGCGRNGHIQIACKARTQPRLKRDSDYRAPSPEAPPCKIAVIQKQDIVEDLAEKVSEDSNE